MRPTGDDAPIKADMDLDDLWIAFVEGVEESVQGGFTERERSLMNASFFAGSFSTYKLIQALTKMAMSGEDGKARTASRLMEIEARLEKSLEDLPGLLRTGQ